MAKDISGDDFEKEVINSDLPVMVDFWGPKCGPCLALMPEVEKLEETYSGKFTLLKIDASQNKRFCLRNKVLGLPTYLYYKDGQEVERISGGELTIEDVVEGLKKII